MTNSVGPLESGHVVIIGGGPGGTGCALALHHMAAEMGRKIEITIVEGKQFEGEMHYNQCLGVLSPPLPDLLWERLGVKFPYHLSRSEISKYVLHTAGEQIDLEDKYHPSIALRRVQYDEYMLETVKEHGITVIPARAVDMEFHADRVIVYTENSPIEGDVVVGAFGMDDGSAAMFSRMTHYRPPLALSSIVTKYHPSLSDMQAFGPCIHAYLPANPRIEFGGVTTKGNHLSINIAGSTVDAELMKEFLRQADVQAILPDFENGEKFDPTALQFYKGRFPRSLAREYFGDRFVLVGDSSGLVRAFKGKGVTNAVITGIRAAETILRYGISEQAFISHYEEANQDIIEDLPYGKWMRYLTIFAAHYRLLDPVLRAAHNDPLLRSALFDAASAHAPYKEVIRQSFHLNTILAILRAWVKGNGAGKGKTLPRSASG